MGSTHQEFDNVINPKSLADRLFGTNQHLRPEERPRRARRCRRSAFRFQAELATLEDRLLLSADPLVPAGSNTPLNRIFWNGGGPSNPAAPPPAFISGIDQTPTEKLITITNTSDQTIFPMLRGANTGTLPSNTNKNNPSNYYDPQDYINQEYRAYIGYVSAGGQQTLGLPAHGTITFRVPLVFWDSERTYIVTDGADLIPADSSSSTQNPFRYDATSDRGVSLSTDANSWVKELTINNNPATGLVMFYHAVTPQGIALDAPTQLTEFTIRDPYLTNWLTETIVAETTVEFNYDVSYVDSLTAPISMEAVNVPVPIPDNPNPPTQGYHYGWAGSSLIYGSPTQKGTMSQYVSDFIKNVGEASIGQYFDGKGWPNYFNPNGILNIPSGASVFANSPLNGQRSSYFTYGPNNLWMLSSGGNGPIEAQAGGVVESNTTLKLYFSRVDQPTLRDKTFDILQGWKDAGLDFFAQTSLNVQLGKVLNFVKDDSDPNLSAIVVTVDGQGGVTGGQSFIFYTKVSDYATTKLTNLWYSWAEYYVNQFSSFTPPAGVTGTINDKTNVLTLDKPIPASLAVGMTVSGPGIVPAAGTVPFILKIDAKNNLIYLSQLATGGGTGTYAFGAPASMPFANADGIKSINVATGGSGYTPISTFPVTITGGGGTGATGVAIVGKDGQVTNVVITNSGRGYTSAPTIGFDQAAKGAGAIASAEVGTFVKTFPLTFPADQLATAKLFAGTVYAAMAAEAAIPAFTVNNPLLPPPMSLIYTTIGCDVLHLPNSNGGVSLVGANVRDLIKSALRGVYDFNSFPESQWYPNPATYQGGQNYNVYNLDPYVWFVHEVLGLSGYGFSVDDDTSDVGAYASNYTPQMQRVYPNHIQMVFSGLSDPVTGQGLPNKSKWYGNVQYGPITVTGSISNPTTGPHKGETIVTLTDQIKYWQIMPPGPDLLGAFVVGQGIPTGTRISKQDFATGLIFVLAGYAPDAQNISLTFTGQDQTTLLRNTGFEHIVLPPSTPLNKVDNPNDTTWNFSKFAGVAGNGSALTALNGPSPDGKQVLYLANQGRVSQKVTLRGGAYVLSFDAARRKRATSADKQAVRVFVDGKQVGVVKPGGTGYSNYKVGFRVGTGRHVITLVGTDGPGNNMVFLDNLSLRSRPIRVR